MPSIPHKILACGVIAATTLLPFSSAMAQHERRDLAATTTPIKYVVVIFQENVSFDHYFATYPNAANTDGIPFHSHRNTPAVNGLTAGLISANPNSTKPFRLTYAQNYTCDEDHGYTSEQKAFDMGLMDKFPEDTGENNTASCDYGKGSGLTMGYYDGNTVTALWNYAQHFAMSDNSYVTTFGPSTPGAINLVSGQTYGVGATTGNMSGNVIAGSVIGDPDPFYDDCSGSTTVAMTGKNVGDLLSAKGVTWGWFEGGFRGVITGGKATCPAATKNLSGAVVGDYSAHHEPFQYYASTANPHHLPPTSVAMIGSADQANHQYDLADFWSAANAGHLPQVSFLKAKKSQDGHASYSSPLDEQQFIVSTINKLQTLPEWNEMAVIINYDDSDGWYDHQMGPILNSSHTGADALNGTGICGNNPNTALGGEQGRCGYGPRLPLVVVSPFARKNFVDSTTTDQSSILRFIEDNWSLGRIDGSFDAIAGPITNMMNFKGERNDGRLFLDPSTGQVQEDSH